MPKDEEFFLSHILANGLTLIWIPNENESEARSSMEVSLIMYTWIRQILT